MHIIGFIGVVMDLVPVFSFVNKIWILIEAKKNWEISLLKTEYIQTQHRRSLFFVCLALMSVAIVTRRNSVDFFYIEMRHLRSVQTTCFLQHYVLHEQWLHNLFLFHSHAYANFFRCGYQMEKILRTKLPPHLKWKLQLI